MEFRDYARFSSELNHYFCRREVRLARSAPPAESQNLRLGMAASFSLPAPIAIHSRLLERIERSNAAAAMGKVVDRVARAGGVGLAFRRALRS